MDKDGHANLEGSTLEDAIIFRHFDLSDGYQELRADLHIYKKMLVLPSLDDHSRVDVTDIMLKSMAVSILQTINKLISNQRLKDQKPMRVSGFDVYIDANSPENGIIVHPSKLGELMFMLGG